jgi:hypothetical protein
MQPDDTPATAETTAEFERDLSTLIMGAFAAGVAVEDTWTITVPAADAPDWAVTIQKTYSDDDPPYTPDLID